MPNSKTVGGPMGVALRAPCPRYAPVPVPQGVPIRGRTGDLLSVACGMRVTNSPTPIVVRQPGTAFFVDESRLARGGRAAGCASYRRVRPAQAARRRRTARRTPRKTRGPDPDPAGAPGDIGGRRA